MSRQLKLPNLAVMVAIGAGTTDSVNRWVVVLAEAGISSTVAQCCDPDPFSPDYAELWVRRCDVDKAHSALWGVLSGC